MIVNCLGNLPECEIKYYAAYYTLSVVRIVSCVKLKKNNVKCRDRCRGDCRDETMPKKKQVAIMQPRNVQLYANLIIVSSFT